MLPKLKNYCKLQSSRDAALERADVRAQTFTAENGFSGPKGFGNQEGPCSQP